jgi:septal ring factor EnvC (AmiA/AmiB activator)
MRPLCALLAALLASAVSTAAAEPTPEQVAKDLKAAEQALEKLRGKTTSILDELGAAEDQVRALEDAAAGAEEQARAAQGRAVAAQREESAAQKSFEALVDALSPRLRARYQMGRTRRASLLFASRSMGDLLWRQRALESILAEDLSLLGKAKGALEQVQQKKAKFEELKKEQLARAEAAKAQRTAALARKEELTRLHASLLDEQDLRERTLDELQKQQEELNRLVGDLHGDGKASSFGRRKGKLPFPAAGLIEVAFGKVVNPMFNTVTFQKGIDLRAPEGTPVIAVGPGKVVHAGPFRGYGNLVIVDHGDGYHSLYAHLARIDAAVGTELDEGKPVGTVGETGSLKGPYLYFEIREKGKPVDPKGWLGAP